MEDVKEVGKEEMMGGRNKGEGICNDFIDGNIWGGLGNDKNGRQVGRKEGRREEGWTEKRKQRTNNGRDEGAKKE